MLEILVSLSSRADCKFQNFKHKDFEDVKRGSDNTSHSASNTRAQSNTTRQSSNTKDTKNNQHLISKGSDNFVKQLGYFVRNLEEIYCINTVMDDGKPISSYRIDVFNEIFLRQFSKLSESTKKKRNLYASSALSSVNYISECLEFFDVVKLDYRKFPGMDRVIDLIIPECKATTATIPKQALAEKERKTLQSNKSLKGSKENSYEASNPAIQFNHLLGVLKQVEGVSVGVIGTLAYRYLRLFYVLYVYGNAISLSILGKFILTQLRGSNRLKEKDNSTIRNFVKSKGGKHFGIK